MSKHIIFVFSGTGNSLWAARQIARELGDCQLISMGIDSQDKLLKNCETIGFVYPTYVGGVPKQVKRFILKTDFSGNEGAYFYGVATCGKISRAENAIAQLSYILKQKKLRLHYGECLSMFSNYVVRYDMSDTAEQDARKAASDIIPIIEKIKGRQSSKMNPMTSRHVMWMGFMLIAPRLDRNFNVSDACVKCGICRKVCPVNNISMNHASKPCFNHHCEHCLACIQNCPTRAINYKDVTQSRKRYTHPDISWKDLAALWKTHPH